MTSNWLFIINMTKKCGEFDDDLNETITGMLTFITACIVIGSLGLNLRVKTENKQINQ